MSMSTHVTGFKPPNAEFKKKLAAYRACEEAGVEVPEELSDYFNDEEPDEAGVVVKDLGKAVKEYCAEMQSGFDIHLDLLPKDVKVIRFVNSW